MTRKIPILIAFLLVFTRLSQADVIIEKTTEESGPSLEYKGKLITRIKGTKVRHDNYSDSGIISVIKDVRTGDSVTFNDKNKSYTLTKGGANKEGMEFARAMMAQGKIKADNMPGTAEFPAPAASGKRQTINGWETEAYVSEKEGTKFTFWIAKDFPDYASIHAQLTAAEDKSVKWLLKGNVPDRSSLPGMIIRMEHTSPKGKNGVETLVSAKETKLSDAEFEPPQGYAKQ